MIFLGIFFVIIGSYISIYIAQLDNVKEMLKSLPSFIPSEFVLNSIVFIMIFFIYYSLQKKYYQKIFDELEILNDSISDFLSTKEFKIDEITTPLIKQTITLIQNFISKYLDLNSKLEKTTQKLENNLENLNQLLNLTNIYVCKINQTGKMVKANEKFLQFLGYDNEVKFNMNIKNIKEIFDELDEEFLEKETSEVVIKGIKFLAKTEVIKDGYILSFIDITRFEKEKEELENRFNLENGLKSVKIINKKFETVMVRILNYENFATYFKEGILEIFEEKFIEKLKNLGYAEIFKVQNDIYAVYDKKIPFDKYKKILEETIVIKVAGSEYIFNPKVVISSGVNYEQAYQQILESSKTLISKEKSLNHYNFDFIKYIHKNIIDNKILLGYKTIEKHSDTIIIYPIIQDEYARVIDSKLVTQVAREFNLYLYMLKQVIITHLNVMKGYKIIINVTSEDLLSTTILSDLLMLIKREELFVTFNIEINSKYSIVLPILKQIKSFAQLGIRRVGHGYLSFKDIYSLKIEYLELDKEIIELINHKPEWKFLIDSVKLLVSAQNTTLIASDYSDAKVLKITKDIKIYD